MLDDFFNCSYLASPHVPLPQVDSPMPRKKLPSSRLPTPHPFDCNSLWEYSNCRSDSPGHTSTNIYDTYETPIFYRSPQDVSDHSIQYSLGNHWNSHRQRTGTSLISIV